MVGWHTGAGGIASNHDNKSYTGHTDIIQVVYNYSAPSISTFYFSKLSLIMYGLQEVRLV